MGTRYLLKPWFRYDDNGIKYISSSTPYASDEFYRHQDVVNSLAGELDKLTHELKQWLGIEPLAHFFCFS